MPIIYFHILSIPDAEEAIAETWHILEEYGIPSPDMTFTFRGTSQVKIALRVDDPVDAQTLMLRLASGGMAPSQRCSRRDFRTSSYQALRHRAFSDQVTIGTDGLTPPSGSSAIRLFRYSALLIAGYFGASHIAVFCIAVF
jgi:hypothetical protein